MQPPTRLAIVVSHPIQHFCPMYSELSRAEWLNVKVFFASSAGLEAYHDPNFGREILWDSLRLDFPHHFLNGGKTLPSNSALDAPDLDAALEEFRPSAVIVYGYRQKLQRRAARWASKRGKVILMISDSELRTARPYWRRALKALVVPRIYERIDGFLSVGDSNELHYQEYGVPAQKCFRSPFPIDRQLFESQYQNSLEIRAAIRRRIGVDASTVICTMVGKLVYWKRQADLIRAVSLINQGSTQTVALIVGTGPEESRLREMAQSVGKGWVIFAGFVQPSELPSYYAATDIYVHAAESEPHSLAISEAIYMGCPVLISDRCGSYGPCDDVQAGRNGFVFKCGDVDDLARMICTVARNPALRGEMSDASRQIGLHAQILGNGAGLRAALRASQLSQADVGDFRAD